MCGFLGDYNCGTTALDDFNDLLSKSVHRGPDWSGTWSNNSIRMGFNRLAILELTESGHQPMFSPHNEYIIVFNGEIYNHKTLRKKLPGNAPYRGNSDTETITYALEKWGINEAVKALDGMFALAIYEFKSGRLYLVRDHAGIKPLYFGQSGRQVVFASQYDQVRQHHLFRQSTINPQVLKLYLKQHYVPAPFGLHMGIEQVRPGEIICFEPTGKRKYFQHWELPDSQEQYIVDPRLAARSVESALRESVHEQLLSDVPLGAFLSGGVDSPLICSFASENDPDFPVFTIGSDSHEHDESGRAKIFNEALGTRQNLWHLNGKEILEHWEEAMQSLHEPLADFSIFPTYLVSKLARQHVTVALSGDGGDELFFGYERFWSVAKNIEFQHWPRLLRMGIYGYDKYFSGNKKFNSLLLTGRQGSAHESLHSRFPDEWIHQIFPDLRRVHLPEKWDLYAYDNRRDIRRLLFQMRKAEFYGMMQKTLRKVDLASMENSLEVRVPFLKKGFIEMANGFDPFLSFGEGQKKKLLKNVLSSRVPKVEDDNVKRGFTVPLGSWIKKELRPVFGDMLLSDKMLNSGVDLQATERMLQEHVNDKDSHKWALFTLYALSRNL